MDTFTVSAEVTVSVAMEIKANTLEEAEGLFRENIMMSASLADTLDGIFDVLEDSISAIDRVEVE